MLSQFTREHEKPVLGDLFKFQKDVYPVGRLDSDSEGLLILTNDKKLNHQLLNPEFAHKRTYLAQVDGAITEEAIDELKSGVTIRINNADYFTKPADAEIISYPKNISERTPPIRFRKSIPTSWIKLTLKEGKNRQVRKMTAVVNFPTLRLIRVAIENLELGELKQGDVKEVFEKTIYEKLKIKKAE